MVRADGMGKSGNLKLVICNCVTRQFGSRPAKPKENCTIAGLPNYQSQITNYKFLLISQSFSSAGHPVPSVRRTLSGPTLRKHSWGNYAAAAPSTRRARD